MSNVQRPQPSPDFLTPTSNTLGLGIFAGEEEPASISPLVPAETPMQQPLPTLQLPQGDDDPDRTPTQRTFSLFPATNPYTPALSPRPLPPRPLLTHRNSSTLRLALDTPLPHQTDEEVEIMTEEAHRPLTPMEKDEFEEGRFGSLPLEVGDGVAVLEESVELHDADVITQY